MLVWFPTLLSAQQHVAFASMSWSKHSEPKQQFEELEHWELFHYCSTVNSDSTSNPGFHHFLTTKTAEHSWMSGHQVLTQTLGPVAAFVKLLHRHECWCNAGSELLVQTNVGGNRPRGVRTVSGRSTWGQWPLEDSGVRSATVPQETLKPRC